MTKKISSVCVYCGASQKVDDSYVSAIQDLGRRLAEGNKTVVYGGGSVGTMGALARSAFDAGGHVIGIIPEHIISREGQEYEISELHVVDSMHTRKMMMVEKSDAFVSMPGGLGTLDETFEILTWKYLGLHDKPVVLGNINGYWDPLLEMLDNMIAEKYSPAHHRDLFYKADTIDDIVEHLEMFDLSGHESLKIDKM